MICEKYLNDLFDHMEQTKMDKYEKGKIHTIDFIKSKLGLTEFVQYAEDGTPDALSYSQMIALLTKSIQELTAKVEMLEKNCNCK